MKTFACLLCAAMLSLIAIAQTPKRQSAAQAEKPTAKSPGILSGNPVRYVYKQADTVTLAIHVYAPAGGAASTPAIVFFFGGGWNSGGVGQFQHQARHLASRGMTAILAEYRTLHSAGTPPQTAVADARSAMRYVRANAAKLGIDPDRIAAAGGSAGGHLAAAAAYVTKFDDPKDDPKVSAVPDALVLFNPVIDNSEKGYGYERVRDCWRDFSPMHNITAGNVRPTLFMVGSKDNLIPTATAYEFQRICEQAGGRCDLKIYEGAPHGFFNYNGKKAGSADFYGQTLQQADDFLISLGYLGK